MGEPVYSYFGTDIEPEERMMVSRLVPPRRTPPDMSVPPSRGTPDRPPLTTGQYPDLGIPGLTTNEQPPYDDLTGMSRDDLISHVWQTAREALGRDPVDEQEAINEAWRAMPSDGMGTGIEVMLYQNPELREPFSAPHQPPRASERPAYQRGIDPNRPHGPLNPSQDEVNDLLDPNNPAGLNRRRSVDDLEFVPDRENRR